MADTTIDGTVDANANERHGVGQMVWLSPDVAYIPYMEVGVDLEYRKLTDFTGTPAYAAAVDIDVAVVRAWCGWYDRWTRGQGGQKYHLAYNETTGHDTSHRSIDFGAADALSAKVDINAGTSYTASTGAVGMCKSRNGDLYCAWNGDGGTEEGFAYSDDDGATWNVLASPWKGAQDFVILMPGGEADADDILGIFLNRTANTVTVLTYDRSGDSWSTTAESSSIATVIDTSSWSHISAAPRHSDDHTIVVGVTQHNDASADIFCVDVTDGTTQTAKTDVRSNFATVASVNVMINQQTDDIYVFYSTALNGQVVYKKSSDGGATWGSETAFQEGAADDIRNIAVCPSIGNNGGAVYAAWVNDDLTQLDTNHVNAITIAAAADSKTDLVQGKLLTGLVG